MRESAAHAMREKAKVLLALASNSTDPSEKRRLASEAFALAQNAEAIERESAFSREQMMQYRLFFRDKAGRPSGSERIRSNSDTGARHSAMALLKQHTEISRIDAWREADFAFRLTRFDLTRREL
jgi:hypothetical protein